jgi:hypothetical protein
VSELGHHVVFWAAGLLAGTLLGWMLERRRAGAAEVQDPKPRSATARVAPDATSLRQLPERRSA